MIRELAALLADRCGNAVVEYGILLSCILLILAVGLTLLGGAINDMFNNTATALTAMG